MSVSSVIHVANSLSASSIFCCLLKIFANSIDPDQVQQNVRMLDLIWIQLFDTDGFPGRIFVKSNFEKYPQNKS